MFQRHRCYVFDSPGVPNDSAGNPGLTYGLWGTTP
ncbi:DNA-directed RNA polymerase [Segatella salivae]